MNQADSIIISQIGSLKNTPFAKELTAIENWFSCLTDTEKLATLHSLIQIIPSVNKPFISRQLNSTSESSNGFKLLDSLIYDDTERFNTHIIRSQTPVEEAISNANWGLGSASNNWNEEQSLVNSLFQTTGSPQLSAMRKIASPAPGLAHPLSAKYSPQQSPPPINSFFKSTQAQPFVPNSHVPNLSPYTIGNVSNDRQSAPTFSPQNQNKSNITYASQVTQAIQTSPQLPFRTYAQSPHSSPLSSNFTSIQKLSNYAPTLQRPSTQSHSSTQIRSGSPSIYRAGSPQLQRSASPWQNDITRLKQTMNIQSDYSESESEYEGLHRPDSRSSHKEKGKIPDAVDVALLKDIPLWFRSLRLHKYTPLFMNMNYKEIIVMCDVQLEAKGVNALGARRKMLKVFEMVKDHIQLHGAM